MQHVSDKKKLSSPQLTDMFEVVVGDATGTVTCTLKKEVVEGPVKDGAIVKFQNVRLRMVGTEHVLDIKQNVLLHRRNISLNFSTQHHYTGDCWTTTPGEELHSHRVRPLGHGGGGRRPHADRERG